MSALGTQLWRSLPELYRSRDNGDLRVYLDTAGSLLDLVRNSIEQRLHDSFPDDENAQSWVMPYLAALVDVHPLAPDDAGRRTEVSRAVGWRQRKGTLGLVAEIAEAIGRYEWEADDPENEPAIRVRVQEGFKRVAVTPRIGDLVQPPGALPIFPPPAGAPAYRTPGLPVAMVDLRWRSRVVTSGGALLTANPGGIPCAPDHWDDTSRRTADLREPTWRTGHAHPRRVLVFTLPRAGFFPDECSAGGASTATPDDHGRTRPRRQPAAVPPQPLTESTTLENAILDNAATPIRITEGDLFLRNCVVTGDVVLDSTGEHLVEDCIVQGTLRHVSGELSVRRSAVRSCSFETAPGPGTVAARVSDSLLSAVAANGLVELEGVTVLGTLSAPQLRACDCILADAVTLADSTPATPHCLRFSRVDDMALIPLLATGEAYQCTSDRPVFVSETFGECGCGVLQPFASGALRSGAEDGGEMGAYHHVHHVLRDEAVRDKLEEHLPVGATAVLVSDDRLRCPPPEGQSA